MSKKACLLLALCGCSFVVKSQNTFPNTGNAGIGTTAPTKNLQIQAQDSPYVLINALTYTNNPATLTRKGGIIFQQQYDDKTAGLLFAVPPGSHMPGILFATKPSYNMPGSGTSAWYDRMFIHPNGNIGIGTTVPGSHYNTNPAYLTYTANNKVLSMYDTLMPVFELSRNAGNIPENKIGVIYFTNTLNQWDGHKQVAGIWAEPVASANYPVLSGGKLVFVTKVINGAVYNRMTLDERGNVAIGAVNTQAYKLAVDGTIGARKVKVTQESWADFVFAPDYALPSLKELESYIRTHRHLPGIPSEKEVLANGLDLGEFGKQLLQKNEEQALYIIDLEKKMEALTERIKKMEELLSIK